MPALPSPGQVLRVNIGITTQSPVVAGSRFFLSYTGGTPSQGNLETLATAIGTAWASNIAPHVSAGEALTEVAVLDLSSDTGAEGIDTTTRAGGASGSAPPSEVAVQVNHKIGRHYRGGKPKTFMRMGMEADRVSEYQWSTSAQAAFLSAWEAWIAAILATTGIGVTLGNIVNVSYYSGFTVFITPSGRARNIPKVRTTPLVDNITSSTVNQVVAVQRRRR